MNGLCSICARRVGARRLRRKRKASSGAERTSIGAAKERAHAGGAVGQVFASLGNRIHKGTGTRAKIAQSNRSGDCRDRYSAQKQSCKASGSSSARTMPCCGKWRRASCGKASTLRASFWHIWRDVNDQFTHISPCRECITQNGAGARHQSTWRPSLRRTYASFVRRAKVLRQEHSRLRGWPGCHDCTTRSRSEPGE